MKRIFAFLISLSISLPLTGQEVPSYANSQKPDTTSIKNIRQLIVAYDNGEYDLAVKLYRQTLQNSFSEGHKFLIAASKSYLKLFELTQVDSLKMKSEKIWNQGILRYGEDFMKTGYDEELYIIVEKNAKPDKGLEKHKKSLHQKLAYPKNALDNKIEGVVYLEFLVTKEGKTAGISVLKGIDKECNMAAIELINNSTWKPARQRGKNVNSMARYMVEFNIKKYEWGLKKYGQ